MSDRSATVSPNEAVVAATTHSEKNESALKRTSLVACCENALQMMHSQCDYEEKCQSVG